MKHRALDNGIQLKPPNQFSVIKNADFKLRILKVIKVENPYGNYKRERSGGFGELTKGINKKRNCEKFKELTEIEIGILDGEKNGPWKIAEVLLRIARFWRF